MAASIPESTDRPSGTVPGRNLQGGLHNRAVIAGTVAIVVGVVVLVGWWLGIDALKSIVPGLATMRVNAAIAFVLLGSGMLLRTRGRRVADLPIAVVIVLNVVVGSEYLLGRDLGIDQWLLREVSGQVGSGEPNRLPPMTIISFMVIGTGVLLAGRRGAERIATTLLLAALAIALFNVLDAALEPTSPTFFTGHPQMPPITAATIMVASIGALGLLPGDGPFAAFGGATSSARLARRLLAASVLVPAVLMWLWLRGEDAGFYGVEYGTSLVVLGTVVFLAAVINQTTRATRRSEAARHRILEERDLFFDISSDMLATANSDGYFIRLNPAWTEALGYDLDELRARPFVDFVHPDDRDATNAEAARQVEQGQTVLNFQNRYRHRDGSYRWLEWTSTPSTDGTRLYATARDVTTRKVEEERLASILAPARDAQLRREDAYKRIKATINSRSFGPVFQPIVELIGLGRFVGFEALTRFDDGNRVDETFAAALDCGLGIELETVTLEAALRRARLLPARAWLSLNVSPSFVTGGGMLASVLASTAHTVVLEITEHEAITAYAPLREAVLGLGPGVRLAVDDAGAGVANFNHLVELRPDFVKIDAGLVRGVEADVGRQAVVAGMVHFAASAGCQVIAEGIETESELAMVKSLGVTLGQGFLLARPAPVEAWSAATSANGPTAAPKRRGRRRGCDSRSGSSRITHGEPAGVRAAMSRTHHT